MTILEGFDMTQVDAPTIHESSGLWFWVHSCGKAGGYYDSESDAGVSGAAHLTGCSGS